MTKTSGPERIKEAVEVLRKWQGIERGSADHASQLVLGSFTLGRPDSMACRRNELAIGAKQPRNEALGCRSIAERPFADLEELGIDGCCRRVLGRTDGANRPLASSGKVRLPDGPFALVGRAFAQGFPLVSYALEPLTARHPDPLRRQKHSRHP